MNYGAKPTFTIKAATDYYVSDVLVDGVSVGPVLAYTFPAVAADHTIDASFAAGAQTRLSIRVAKATITYGSATLLTGVLYDSADALHEVGMAAQHVTVQSALSYTGPWVDRKTLTTDSTAGSEGGWSWAVAPTRSTYYRVRFLSDPNSDYGSVLSYFVKVGVRPALSVPTAPKYAKAKRWFTVLGTLKPRFTAGHKTVLVKVFRYQKRHWILVKQVSATNANGGANTRYQAKVRLTTRGKYRFSAYTAATVTWAGTTTGLSRVLSVK